DVWSDRAHGEPFRKATQTTDMAKMTAVDDLEGLAPVSPSPDRVAGRRSPFDFPRSLASWLVNGTEVIGWSWFRVLLIGCSRQFFVRDRIRRERAMISP